MKKKLLCFCFLFLNLFILNAQEVPPEKNKFIGIGIRSSVFHISEIPVNIVPPNRLLLNIDPLKYARVEFHYGFYKNTREVAFNVFPSTTRILKITDKSSITGMGLFGTYPVDKLRFILGARYSVNNYSEGDIKYDGYGNAAVITNKGKINILAGVLGGEYYFSKYFSVGAEFSLISMSDKYTPAEKTNPALTTETTVTESSLVFRFFPY